MSWHFFAHKSSTIFHGGAPAIVTSSKLRPVASLPRLKRLHTLVCYYTVVGFLNTGWRFFSSRVRDVVSPSVFFIPKICLIAATSFDGYP